MINAFAAPGYPVFLGSEFDHPAQQDAYFHVLPVPLEASVSYGAGTGAGPASILTASWQLETLDRDSCPADLGIHTLPPIDTQAAIDVVMSRIAAATARVVAAEKLPVLLGGEHTLSDGAVQGILDAGMSEFGLVKIDAHADLRAAFQGVCPRGCWTPAEQSALRICAGVPFVRLPCIGWTRSVAMTMLRRCHPFGQELDDGVALTHMADILRSSDRPAFLQSRSRQPADRR